MQYYHKLNFNAMEIIMKLDIDNNTISKEQPDIFSDKTLNKILKKEKRDRKREKKLQEHINKTNNNNKSDNWKKPECQYHYKLNDKFTFGKFKGKTVKELVDAEEFNYLSWCEQNNIVEFMDENGYIKDVVKKYKQQNNLSSWDLIENLNNMFCRENDCITRVGPHGYIDIDYWDDINEQLGGDISESCFMGW